MLVVDQGNQHKNIVAATVLDYNQNTIFGTEPSGKRTWLGKYDTPEQAQIVLRDMERALNQDEAVYNMP